MNNQPHYVNKKGKIVNLTISPHAQKRFLERWPKVFPDKPVSKENVISVISEKFSHANKVQNLTTKEQKRIKSYGNGKDTIFFRTNGFTFVVENACIVTIEISDKNQRVLNKVPIPPALNTKKSIE